MRKLWRRSSVPVLGVAAFMFSFGCSQKWPGRDDSEFDGGIWQPPPPADAAPVDMDAGVDGPDLGLPPSDGGDAFDAGLPDMGFPTWAEHVRPIVERRCVECHSTPPRFSATRPLVTHQDTLSLQTVDGRPVHQLMAERVMATENFMPPPSRGGPLPPNEAALIAVWSQQGAPEGRDPNMVTEYEYHRDVAPIVNEYCGLCHGNPPAFGAPRALASYGDMTQVNQFGQPIYEMVAFRLSADQNRMPPPQQPQPSAEQREIVRNWAQGGAPEGEPFDAGVPEDAGVMPDAGWSIPWLDGGTVGPHPNAPTERYFEILAHDINGGAARPSHEMPVGDTSYECWSFPVNMPNGLTEEFVTMLEWYIDNTAHVHHMMAFHDPSAGPLLGNQTVGPYDCFGFPIRADGNGFTEYLDGWFPGRRPSVTPTGVGMRIQPGDHIVLQMHYDAVDGPGRFDQSGIRLTLDSTQLTAAGALWSGAIWNTPLNGPNETRVGECEVVQTMTMYQTFPHMHTFGTRIITDVQRAGSQNWTPLAVIDPWNFLDQPILPVPSNLEVLQPGDRIRTRCWWNTRGQVVRQGDGSLDEMCFTTIFHYPIHPNSSPSPGGCVTFGP